MKEFDVQVGFNIDGYSLNKIPYTYGTVLIADKNGTTKTPKGGNEGKREEITKPQLQEDG